MSELTREQRVDQLKAAYDRLMRQRDRVMAIFNEDLRDLENEVTLLMSQMIREKIGDPYLEIGDRLLITPHFWNEKKLSDFSNGWHEPRAYVEISSFYVTATNTLRVAVQLNGDITGTTITYMTAQVMRQAWLAANPETA